MPNPSATFRKTFLLLGAVVSLCAQFLGSNCAKSEEVESTEAKAALNALVKENAAIERKLEDAEDSKAALQKNLAVATGEAEVLKRQLLEMRLRLEAFGLQGQGSEASLEQRLLKAVSALRTAEQQKTALAAAVIALSDSLDKTRQHIQDVDVETRTMLESASTQGREALAAMQTDEDASSDSPVANEGIVIATKDDLALIVTSIGREVGVKVGMPFRVIRGDQEIGSVRIVDVRDRISGAVVQELATGSEKIRVGDKLKIGADRRM